MPDKMRADVENYKIGPDEKRFLKRFRDMLRAETLLQAIGQQTSLQMKNILSLYGEVKQEKQRLLSVPPNVQEIPGQNFGETGEQTAEQIQAQPDKWSINY